MQVLSAVMFFAVFLDRIGFCPAAHMKLTIQAAPEIDPKKQHEKKIEKGSKKDKEKAQYKTLSGQIVPGGARLEYVVKNQDPEKQKKQKNQQGHNLEYQAADWMRNVVGIYIVIDKRDSLFEFCCRVVWIDYMYRFFHKVVLLFSL